MKILEKEYIPRPIRPAVSEIGRRLCKFADRASNHVVAASPRVAEQLCERTCTVVRNYPEELPQSEGPPEYEDHNNRVVYAGIISQARGLRR